MSPIFDLNPRPENEAARSDPQPAPMPQSGPLKGSVRPPDAGVQSDAAKIPAPPPAHESVKPAEPARPPSPWKKSPRPTPPGTAQPVNPARAFETAQAPGAKTRPESVPVSEPVNIPSEPAAESEAPAKPGGQSDEGEFELLLGRRQIASWLFVGTLLIAIFSAAAYFVGKFSAPGCVGALADQTVPYVAPPLPAATIVTPGQEPNLDANTALPPEASNPAPIASAIPPASAVSPGLGSAGSSGSAAAGSASVSGPAGAPAPAAGLAGFVEPPIFAQPQPGALYLQMGAVDKGIAVVLAEGLRKHGFTAIVAPGPNEKIFRVLIGPLADQEGYKRAKAQVDAIDLSTFARRFQK
jgi:hypothetical protein